MQILASLFTLEINKCLFPIHHSCIRVMWFVQKPGLDHEGHLRKITTRHIRNSLC